MLLSGVTTLSPTLISSIFTKPEGVKTSSPCLSALPPPAPSYVQVISLRSPRLTAAIYRYIDQTISSSLLRETSVSTHLSVLPFGIVVTCSLSGFIRYCLLESFTELESCFLIGGRVFTTYEDHISCRIL